MKGKNYDYKEAYNKGLTAKARLHYLENARNDQDNSPVKHVFAGSLLITSKASWNSRSINSANQFSR